MQQDSDDGQEFLMPTKKSGGIGFQRFQPDILKTILTGWKPIPPLDLPLDLPLDGRVKNVQSATKFRDSF